MGRFVVLIPNAMSTRWWRIHAKSAPRRILRALAVLRGGAKQAAFATDVAPKVLVLAGLSCGNPVFSPLLKEDDHRPILDIARLEEIVRDYTARLCTPVFGGIREA